MNRPECVAAVEYLRRTGTEAPIAKLAAGLRTIFARLERAADRTPPNVLALRPSAGAWSVHEIVDHLVETHRPAAEELRALCAGVEPVGGPIPARLRSAAPFSRPWPDLVDQLKEIHRRIIEIVASADPAAPLTARAPFVMVLEIDAAHGHDVVEWVERLDWKAYAQGIRVHCHEHLAQIDRTVAAVERAWATLIETKLE
jgi:DinB superfamily